MSALAVREPLGIDHDEAVSSLTPVQHFELMSHTLRLALADAKTPRDARDAMDRATVAEAYAKAWLSEEHVLDAQEVHVWACRRAGEIRAELPEGGIAVFDWDEAKRLSDEGKSNKEIGDALGVGAQSIRYAKRCGFKRRKTDGAERAQFNEEFGISTSTASRWQRLASIPERELVALIEDAKRRRQGLTANAIIARATGSRPVRVESGIYRKPNSQLAIKGVRDNRRFWTPLPKSSTIDEARHALAVARGRVKDPRIASSDVTLSHVYESVVQAREQFAKARGSLSREQRLALGPLYEELDDLAKRIVKATNL